MGGSPDREEHASPTNDEPRILWTVDQRELLLRAYQIERQAESQSLSTLTAIIATSVGALGLIGSAFAFATNGGLSAWLLAFVPYAPIPLIAWGAACVSVIVARGRLIDVYEHELRTFSDMSLGKLPVPSGQSVLSSWWQGVDGEIAMSIGLLTLFGLYVGVVAAAGYESYGVHWYLCLISTLPCSLMIAALFVVYLRGLNGRVSLERLAKRSFDINIAIRNRPAKAPPTLTYRLIDRTLAIRLRGTSDSSKSDPI